MAESEMAESEMAEFEMAEFEISNGFYKEILAQNSGA